MGGTSDNVKGRVKEAAGALTDDDSLKREGKTDQAAGTAKDKVRDAADKVESGVDAVTDKLKGKDA